MDNVTILAVHTIHWWISSREGKKKTRAPRLTANTKIANTITKRQWSEKGRLRQRLCGVFFFGYYCFFLFSFSRKIKTNSAAGYWASIIIGEEKKEKKKMGDYISIQPGVCLLWILKRVHHLFFFLFYTGVAVCQTFLSIGHSAHKLVEPNLYTAQRNFQTKTFHWCIKSY